MVDFVALVIPNEFTINKIVDLGFDIATSLTIFGSIFLLYLTLNKERKKDQALKEEQRQLGLDEATRSSAADQLGGILTLLSDQYANTQESSQSASFQKCSISNLREFEKGICKFQKQLASSKYIILPIFEIQVEKDYIKARRNNSEKSKFEDDMDDFLKYCRETTFQEMKKDDFETVYKKARDVFRVKAYSDWLNSFVENVSKRDHEFIKTMHPVDDNEGKPVTRGQVNQLIWRVMTRVKGSYFKNLDLKSLMLYNAPHKRKLKDRIDNLDRLMSELSGALEAIDQDSEEKVEKENEEVIEKLQGVTRKLKKECEDILASLSVSHHKMLANCEDRAFDELFEYYQRSFKEC